jgi:hypothetical protein
MAKTRWRLVGAVGLAAAVLASALEPGRAAGVVAPAPAAEKPAAETPKAEPKLVSSQWFSIYLAGKKTGYSTRSLYELAGGHRRLVTNQFLRQGPGMDKFSYYKTISAEVDATSRPHAVECRVVAGERQWQVQGHVQEGQLVLKRTTGAGDGAPAEASAKIPLDADVTFLSWTVPATLLSGPKPGEARRWLAIDESIGALLPTPCFVQVAGYRGMAAGRDNVPTAAAAVLWSLGPEQVVHLVDRNGQILRSVWQSTPMVAEATSLSEARRLVGIPDGPHGVEIEGLTDERYQNARLGLSVRIPPYPYIAHVAPQAGIVEVTDTTDEAYIALQPLPGLRAAGGPVTEADAARQADLLQREWAAKFEDVTAELVRSDEPTTGAPGARRTVQGTARLGCTTFHFRNSLLAGSGLPWFVSVAVADRPLVTKPLLTQTVPESVRLTPPEGQLPLQVVGDLIRSPFYGFEIRRPSGRWKMPAHVDGPVTVLEMAREDRAAVAVIRVLTPKPGQTLEALASEQAHAAADNLDVTRPEPRATTLAGQKAMEIVYAGPRVFGGGPGRCTAVYMPLDSRVLGLFLLLKADADESAVKDVQQIRESLKLSRPAAGTR